MINASFVFGTAGAVTGGAVSWIAMSVARAQARTSSELGFIQNAKLAFFLMVAVSGCLLWAAAQVLSLDDELSKPERHAYLALPLAFFAAALAVGFACVLVENSKRKKDKRERLASAVRDARQRGEAAFGPARIAKVPQLPKTLRPSTRSLIKPILGAFLLIAWGAYRWSQSSMVGPPIAGLGVLLLFLALATVVSGSVYLKINDEKFTVNSVFGARTILFSEIDAFEIYAATHGRKVGWNYRPGTAPKRARKLNARVLGVDDALVSNYGLLPDELCDLMNDTLKFSQRKSPKSLPN